MRPVKQSAFRGRGVDATLLSVLLLGLTAVPAAAAEEPGDKPLLVLDAGGHTAPISQVLFTPDGRQVISTSLDNTARLWDVKSGDCLQVFRLPQLPGASGKIYAAALSADGRTLALGGYNLGEPDSNSIYLVALLDRRIERVLKGHTDTVSALAFSPDGKWLASGSADATARIWDLQTGRCRWKREEHRGDVLAVAFSPDSHHLATASADHTARLWSVDRGQSEVLLRQHTDRVGCVAWSGDGKLLVTGSDDRSFCLWTPSGQLQQQARLNGQVRVVAFRQESGARELLLALGEAGHAGAHLVDLDKGQVRVSFLEHRDSIVAGALSPDGTLAATADLLQVCLWQTRDGHLVHRLTGRGQPVYAAAWPPDGNTLSWTNNSAGYKPPNAILPPDHFFRVPDLELQLPAHPEREVSSKNIVRDHTRSDHVQQAVVRQGDWSLGEPVGGRLPVQHGSEPGVSLDLPGRGDRITCFTLLSDNRAALGSQSGGVYLYDLTNGHRLVDAVGHADMVLALAPSPDGNYLLSASADQTLHVWDLNRPEPRQKPLLSFFGADTDWIAWTPEGYYAASPGGERLMGWQVNHSLEQLAAFHPAADFRKSLYRPDIIQRLLKSGSVELARQQADRERDRPSRPQTVGQVLPPRVQILAPEHSGTQVQQPDLKVQAVAQGSAEHPVTTLRLLLDERPYQEETAARNIVRDQAAEPGGEVRRSWTVRLQPGKHRLAVEAQSAVSKAVSDEVEVVYAAEQVELPRLYVLAVGVSAYPGPLALACAAKDARDLASAFQADSRPLFRGVEVKVVTDQEATRKGVLQGLDWLRRQMTQKDIGVLFFSGHGVRAGDGSLYLAPVDIDPRDILSTGVPAEQVKKLLADTPGRLLVLLDACHTGAIGGDRRKALGGLTDDLVRDLVNDDYGVVIMCASMAQEFSLESPDLHQGYFTLALLEGLGGKADANHDGVVGLTELDAYVSERVKQLSDGEQHPVTTKPTTVRSFPLAKP